MTHIEDTELRDKIVKLMHPVSFKVIYPETQMEENYPIANSIVDLIQQERLKAKIEELKDWAVDADYNNEGKVGPVDARIAKLESLLNKELK